MGGSRKPRRRRAASGSLTHTARPSRKADAPSGRRRDTVFGCGCMVAVVLGIVVPAIGSTLGGPGLWRWARDSFPGGGYGFAVAVGALIPVAFTVGAISLGKLNQAAEKARSAVGIGIAVLCFALLMLLGTACVEMMGPSREHHARTGGWAYEHYAWVWAVALLSALVTGALIVTALVLRVRSRTAQDGSAETA
ncbi:hypothetical protein ACFVYE_08040 [Streptomyces sp. NPDC058239]|uniref:hypothetical protein n=1 Tax=Streptomyces sp. NPDC058239 TaxID=3346395 RepID=UPI0036ECE132